MEKQFIYTHEGEEYIVNVTYKRGLRYIHYYFKKGQFTISCPYFTLKTTLISGLDKYFDKLIAQNPVNKAEGEDYIYILGNRYNINKNGGILPFNDGTNIIYKDKNNLKSQLFSWFLNFITNRHNYYEGVMGTSHYKVRIKNVTSRYGSNSLRTKSITYSTVLMHYSKDIIDSVIVHELAHHYQRNHSPKFYKVVYQYCPNYKKLHTKLRKGEFQ